MSYNDCFCNQKEDEKDNKKKIDENSNVGIWNEAGGDKDGATGEGVSEISRGF